MKLRELLEQLNSMYPELLAQDDVLIRFQGEFYSIDEISSALLGDKSIVIIDVVYEE